MKKEKAQFEKWAAGVLVVICVALALNLVYRGGIRAAASRGATLGSVASPAVTRAKPQTRPVRDELSRYDPELDLETLGKFESRPEPKLNRNPFVFPPPPAPKVTASQAANATPPPPPPPPPPPFKAVGYTERPDGNAEAIVTDASGQEVYVIHIGETFAKHYRVLSLSPTKVEIQDVTSGQTAQLPISQ